MTCGGAFWFERVITYFSDLVSKLNQDLQPITDEN